MITIIDQSNILLEYKRPEMPLTSEITEEVTITKISANQITILTKIKLEDPEAIVTQEDHNREVVRTRVQTMKILPEHQDVEVNTIHAQEVRAMLEHQMAILEHQTPTIVIF